MRLHVARPAIGPPVPYRRPLFALLHALLALLSYSMAFMLRFEFDIPPRHFEAFLITAPALVAVRMAFFWRYHLFGGLWRYVGMHDLADIIKAVVGATFVFAAGVLAFYRYGFGKGYPRSVILLDALICVGLVAGVRVATRRRHEAGPSRRTATARRAMIVGAGEAAEALLRGLQHHSLLNYRVVGLVDDDRRAQGSQIHGVRVVGDVDRLPELVASLRAEEILLAIPSATGEARRRLLARCRASGVPVKTVPSLEDLFAGKRQISQLEDILPEDLLDRAPVVVDASRVLAEIQGRCVLVTGAGGSIGSELCRQLAGLDPKSLILYERAESALYFNDLALRDRHPRVGIVPVVGDVLDGRLLAETFARHRPEVVYHAAAYKHVPLMESHPIAAIENNVFGTETLAVAATSHGVKKFVLISTDKAVAPVGIMGMTKRVSEDLLRSLAGGPTAFVAVRFGNVLGSAGSVLPLFQAQIARGGPVTVTDPEAQRYFMLVAEAAQLVLQAGAMGRGGEVFFLDMGDPVKIGDLADSLIRLSGQVPGRDVAVETVGLRPGERLTEELTRSQEQLASSDHDKVMVVRAAALDVRRFQEDFELLRSLVANRRAQDAREQLRVMATRY